MGLLVVLRMDSLFVYWLLAGVERLPYQPNEPFGGYDGVVLIFGLAASCLFDPADQGIAFLHDVFDRAA